jgi:hypothetical protein
MVARVILCAMLAMSAPATVAAEPTAAPAVEPAPSPQSLLGSIRARFHARSLPPFESYTLTRSQNTATGVLDFPNSYSKRVWVRNSDRTALTRTVLSNGTRGPLEFDRPAFNEERDPGPPTADMFESPNGVSDYRVDSLETQGDLLHLRISPVLNADRNRLREVFADKQTYELRTLIAVDALFIVRGPVYPVTFTITMGAVDGYPVVTAAHGVVGGDYNGDGKEVDYTFTAISFPATLPDWYFDPRTYGQHGGDAPV